MKRQNLSAALLLMALVLILAVSLGAGAEREQQALADRLIRLHVLANSDTPADQAEKLRVRDAVLSEAEGLLRPGMTRREAAAALETAFPRLAAAAAAQAGERPVTVTLGREYYPTRAYDSFTLPAGESLSLQVRIGEGEGHNWWCVVFPPLCSELAEEKAEAAWDLSEEELQLISEKEGVQIRFRLVEWWQELLRAANRVEKP